MILGFKTGPNNFSEGQQIVTDLGASMCEVWFNVNKHEEYSEMFSWLQNHNVAIGLHYWGLVGGNIKPNLSTQDADIRNETMKQIRQTIDIGSDIGCIYVNVHPGADRVETINFTNWEQSLAHHAVTPPDVARNALLQATQELNEYANKKNILLTTETVPGLEKANDNERESVYDSGTTPLATLELLANKGMWIANDITHTASKLLAKELDNATAWKKLLEFSSAVAPQTRLLHINTITPPYNGADSHDGITNEDFEKETFPNKEGMREFLRLFKNRDDVYVVPEPNNNHAGNYLALQALVTSL